MIATIGTTYFTRSDRINEHADGDKKHRAEKVPHRVHERLDLIDLTGLGDDGTDQKSP